MVNDDEIYWKSRVALAAAILAAGGDYHRVDFDAARAVWLANLTPAECIRTAELEAQHDDDGDRVTPEAVQFLEDLGCWNAPAPDAIN